MSRAKKSQAGTGRLKRNGLHCTPDRFTRLETLVRFAEKRSDIMAQHGPVKIIMKDGKHIP